MIKHRQTIKIDRAESEETDSWKLIGQYTNKLKELS